MKYVALLDCNNFFVSCERLFRPDLKNVPVVVLSSNDGCVVARSKEIKDMAIPMGVPYFQIKDTLKNIGAVAFSSHFALYRDISSRVFDVVRLSFPDIEQYSIDECFFTFDSDNPEEVARALKEQVERLVGIPVSVGVSLSKTQAKYASSVAKKTSGTAVLEADYWQENSSSITLAEIWGVGGGRARNFSEKGIVTIEDLIKLDTSLLARFFGVEGVRLKEELQGRQVLAVKPIRNAQKSVMSTRSFAETTTSYPVLEDAVMYHLYQGVKDLEMMNLLTVSLRVMISPSRHGDYAFFGASKEVVLTSPTSDLFTLQNVAGDLLRACYQPDVPYKKAGIAMSELVSPQSKTESLFKNDEVRQDKTSELTKTIMDINKKHGKSLLQLGRTEIKSVDWRVRKDVLSPSYTTSWSELKVVRS